VILAVSAIVERLGHPNTYAATKKIDSNKIMGLRPFSSLEAIHSQRADLFH
jgi:hypothetical protein